MGAGGLLGRTRTVWREARDLFQRAPRLRLFLAAYLVSGVLSGLLVPVLPLFFLERGLTFLQLGGIYSLVAVTSIGVQLLSGRHHRFFGRPAVVLSLLAVTVFTFPAYLWVRTPLHYLAVTAAGSLAGAASGPGLQVLLAEAAPRNVRATVFAYFGLTKGWSYALGLVMGGLGLGLGYAAVFLFGSLLALTSFFVMSALVVSRGPGGARVVPLDETEREHYARSRSLRASLRPVRTRLQRARGRLESRLPVPRQAARNVRFATLYLFLFGLAVAVYPVYFPRHLIDQGLPLHWVGIVSASSWITFGIVQPFGARYADRTRRHKPLLVAGLVAAAACNLVMATASLPWIVAAWLVLGLADGLARPVTAALILASVPPMQRGRAFGWSEASITASRVVAPYALAFVAMSHGIATALVLVTFVILLAAVPPLLIQEMREPEAQTPAPNAVGGAA